VPPKPFHEKAIQVKADVAAFLKIIASVWLHDSTPTHGRRQPAAAPTQVCVCMGPATQRIPHTFSPTSWRPELDLGSRPTAVGPATPFRLASIRTRSESRWTRCSLRFV